MFGIQVIVSVNLINLGEYLDYSSCKCRKKLIDPLEKNIDETKLVNITVENENNSRCTSYLVYKVLFFIFFIINCGIIIYFVYQINLKNRTYFYNDIINLDEFDESKIRRLKEE